MAMSTEQSLGERWAAVAALPPPEQQVAMRHVLNEVLMQQQAERSATIIEMVQGEYRQDEAALHTFTRSRLRVWLALAEDRPDDAQMIAREYNEAFDTLPGELAMRRATIVQSVVRSDLSPEEVARLMDLFPEIARQIPAGTVSVADGTVRRSAPSNLALPIPSAPAIPTRTQPRWKFWRRD